MTQDGQVELAQPTTQPWRTAQAVVDWNRDDIPSHLHVKVERAIHSGYRPEAVVEAPEPQKIPYHTRLLRTVGDTAALLPFPGIIVLWLFMLWGFGGYAIAGYLCVGITAAVCVGLHLITVNDPDPYRTPVTRHEITCELVNFASNSRENDLHRRAQLAYRSIMDSRVRRDGLLDETDLTGALSPIMDDILHRLTTAQRYRADAAEQASSARDAVEARIDEHLDDVEKVVALIERRARTVDEQDAARAKVERQERIAVEARRAEEMAAAVDLELGSQSPRTTLAAQWLADDD